MSFFESLAKIFSALFGSGKSKLDEVSVQDLERERNTLEGKLRTKERDANAMEQDKTQLLEDYKAAVASKNEAAKRTIAQKLQRADMSLKSLNASITQFGKRIQALDNLILIKETEPEKGIIEQIDVDDIQDKAVDRQLKIQEDKAKQEAIHSVVDDMLNTASESDYAMDDYMAQLDAQIASENPVAESSSGGFDRIDEAIKRGDAAAQKLQEPSTSEEKQ